MYDQDEETEQFNPGFEIVEADGRSSELTMRSDIPFDDALDAALLGAGASIEVLPVL